MLITYSPLHSVVFLQVNLDFPYEDAKQIAIDTVRTYLKETNSKIQVVFNVFRI